MPTLKDTKRRIVSVKNTQKITRAMKLVSSAKFTRANHNVLNARPYGDSLDSMIAKLITSDDVSSPLLVEKQEQKILLLVVATDRGLCGGLNANLIKACQKFLDEKKSKGITVELMFWGRRSEAVANNRREAVVSKHEKVLDKPSYPFAYTASKKLSKDFLAAKFDRIYCAYAQFQNAMTQTPKIDPILPVSRVSPKQDQPKDTQRDFILEPNKNALLTSLLEKQVANKLFRIMLEGSASEHAARMTAMDNATNNADEVIRRLTLDYNRARQAAITKELIEITSGAEAL